MSDETTTTAATPAPEVKPGFKTSEFWLTTAATVVGLLMASDVIPSDGIWPKLVGLAAGVLGALGYSVVRANIKKA